MKGSVPIVLIPQPSDDPNDPLVQINSLVARRLGCNNTATDGRNSFALELAIMEARCDYAYIEH